MTRKEITEGLKLLEDNMVYFDELLNDKGEYIDVHELLFESIEALKQEPTKEEKAILQKWRDNRGISIEDFEDAMEALEQQPCEDAISRSEVIKSIDEREDVNGKVDAESVRTDIVLMPPVNPQPKTDFERKAEIVISQLRADRDRLQDAIEKIKAEIDDATEIHSDGEFYIKNIDVKRIIDKYKAESEDKE